MSQWGQAQQPGFQYPMQTGFPGNNPQFQQQQNPQFQPQNPQFQQQNPQFQQQNPQFQQQNPQFQQQNPQFQQPGGFGGPGLAPQATGFPGARPQGFQHPQQTGFHGGSGFVPPQPTGFQGSNFQQQIRAAPPPVPPIPSQFQQPNQSSGFLGVQQQQQHQQHQQQQLQPQVNRFLSASPGVGSPGGLLPQATGFPGGRPGGGALIPQMTGYVDPRLQMMSNTFMPMSSTMGAGVTPQLAPPQFNLQQSIQQHNQAQRGTATPQMTWTLTKQEKKQYNDIFRSWDAQSTGFISGQTALEVFGASGLPKDELARIWTLADIDDRGKLNIAEFHVAMGLIYRRLSGMPVPDQLPPELVPPSARDLNNSVDMVMDLLKNESRNRSPSSIDTPVSRAKVRSFNNPASAVDSNRDATIYKHNDTQPPGDFYKPRSRHVNRDDVRSRNDEDSPSADLEDMKRRLANTAKMLDHAAEADASRSAEDEALDRELEDLKYRVKRVSEDLEYVSSGPKSVAKDQERRKLERELLDLMHERVPAVERKIKARDERKEREKRQWARDRDRANDRFGRYDSREDSYSRRYDDDRDRPYSRGSYRDRDRDDSRDDDRYRRDERSRSRERDRYRDQDRPRSSPRARSPPPPPPSTAPPSTIRDLPAAPPPPKATPSPAPLKRMTVEERQAYAREQAKRRIEERRAALGVTVPPSSPAIDTSVEDRLQQDKKEAEEKARQAEKQTEERERMRKERLESEKAAASAPSPSPAPAAVPTPTRTVPAPTAAAPTPTPRAPPPAPKPRAPAPPPPRKAPAIRQTPVPAAVPPVQKPPQVVIPPPAPEVDPEEEALRAREEAIKKQREARAEKLRQLEREEAEAARIEEEKYQARLQALKVRTTPSPAPPVAPTPPPMAPVAPTPPKAPTPPVAPPPPVISPPAVEPAKSTNPFSRMIKEGATASPTTPFSTNGNTNPWTKPQTAPASSTPEPPSNAAPKSYNTAQTSSIEDDWDDIKENVEDDSSDDEYSGREKRADLARQLFGNMAPSSRPQSAAANARPGSTPSSPAPPPAAPPAPPAPPPAPPMPPVTQASAAVSPPPPPPTAPAASGDRGDLFRSIQGGLKLRPAKTVDKSAPPLSGRVIGDAAPPAHIITAAAGAPSPELPSNMATQDSRFEEYNVPEPPLMDQGAPKLNNRQSVGWFADRAADAGTRHEVERLPSTTEEDEEYVSVPAIHINEASSDSVNDPLADIDKSIEHRARSLYAYQGDGPDDLTFGENLIMTVHPSKSGGDWWYGTLVSSRQSGLFPRTYIDVVNPIKAKAIYSYTGSNSDELPFTEGDELTIIDKNEEEWWKAEQDGVVFIVPAAYLEVVDGTPMISESAVEVKDQTMSLAEPHTKAVGDLPSDPEQSNMEEDESDSSSDYLSFNESDEEDEYPETKVEREARAHERQLVLEAAGLILKQDDDHKPPPRPVRVRSVRRRPPPTIPRQSEAMSKDLPPIPEPMPEPKLDAEPMDHLRRLDDAFERYESFKSTQANRMSYASSIETPPSPTAASLTSPVTLKENEGGRSYHNFLHFLGRAKTPEGSRRNLSISGPIMSNSEDPSRSASPAFGTSWASLVDKTALDGIPPGERRRQEAIFELINTEAAYVRDLQLIIEIFYSKMVPMLSTKEVTVIFANIEDILLTNTAFLSSLEERQKDCRLYMDRIGDILLHHIPNMSVYMAYCVNQPTAIKVLKSLRQSNVQLESYLTFIRDDPAVRNLDLSSYLLAPMQRITRYPLLIKQILHHTEVESEQRDIQKVVEIAENNLEQINEAIRDQEGREKLKTLSQHLWIGQGRLDLTAPTRYMGTRRLIREGTLMKAKSGRRLYGFLCSDILVLTDEPMKTLYRMPIPLAQARVQEAGRDDLTFEVTQAYPRGGDSIALKATSVRDCQMWMQEIEHAGRRCRHAEERAVRKQRR